jgi:hypothetical protein
MAKLTNVRERIHQPFYDTLIRTSGLGGVTISDRESLFTNRTRAGDLQALTNLENGSTLPSDQSHVTLALRVFTWFRAPVIRGVAAGDGVVASNGDFANTGTNSVVSFFGTGGPAVGNAVGRYQDVYRLHYQAMEQLHWSYGTGQKYSILNMPTKYFPDGGGLSGDAGGVTDLIHFQNGDAGHTSILRLARAILLPPRQNVICQGVISALPGAPTAVNPGTTDTNGRNYLSLRDNLNAVDGVNKVVQFMFDGLYARDVQ